MVKRRNQDETNEDNGIKKGKEEKEESGDGINSTLKSGVGAVYSGTKWTLGTILSVPAGITKSAFSFVTDPVNGLVTEVTALCRKTSAVVFPTISILFGTQLTLSCGKFFTMSRRASAVMFVSSSFMMTMLTAREDIYWCAVFNDKSIVVPTVVINPDEAKKQKEKEKKKNDK